MPSRNICSAVDLIRTDCFALKLYAEDMAVARILRAADEPSLDGDLDALASQI
jgi:hypothetical protein